MPSTRRRAEDVGPKGYEMNRVGVQEWSARAPGCESFAAASCHVFICACIQSVNGQASTRKDFELTTTLLILLPPDDIPSLCSLSQSTNSIRPSPPPRLYSSSPGNLHHKGHEPRTSGGGRSLHHRRRLPEPRLLAIDGQSRSGKGTISRIVGTGSAEGASC